MTIKEFHNATHRVRQIADFLEVKADAFRTVLQIELADELDLAGEDLRHALKKIEDAMTAELQSHTNTQMLHQSVMIGTLIELGKDRKEAQS